MNASSFFTRYRIELTAAAASLLLSLWLVYTDGVVNRDGVLYLTSAEEFANGSWREALQIYRWPLFSMLIATVHLVTGLSFEIAAYVINTALYVLLVCAFIRIVRVLGADDRTLWLATLFILILPSVNTYRSFVIRDVGFWAFYLVALLHLVQYRIRPSVSRGVTWGMAMSIATLFRIEGLAFVVVMPLAVVGGYRQGWRSLTTRFFQLYWIALAGAVAAGVWLSTAGSRALSGRLLEPNVWLRRFGEQILSGLATKADSLARSVLNDYSDDFAMSSVVLILALIALTHVLKGLSLLGAWATARSWWAPATPARGRAQRILGLAIVLNVVILIVFVTIQFFLTGRYVIALVLTLGLYVPFGLNALFREWKTGCGHSTSRLKYAAVAILVCYMTVDNVWSFGVSNKYLRDAGLWARANIPNTARLYSTNPIVSYYADKIERTDSPNAQIGEEIVESEKLNQYDYLALTVKHDNEAPGTLATAPVMREFKNERNDRVLIFKVADLPPAH